ncbi:MAG: hypothetical protein SGPRY_006911 [Prymnesium sp.]
MSAGASLRSCPILIRSFLKASEHHRRAAASCPSHPPRLASHRATHRSPQDFAERGNEPEEIRVYSWLDATLGEVAELVQQEQMAADMIHSIAPSGDVRLSFSTVYPGLSSTGALAMHKRGDLVIKDCGKVRTRRRGADDSKTLEQVGFQPGDFLDIAVLEC